MEKGGEKSGEGGAEKEENLGKKLRREVLIGKRCGPCTPVPSWRIWAPPQETIISQTDPFHHNTYFSSASSISARKLAAALWEFHQYLPLPKMHRAPNNGVSNGAAAADSRLIRRRYFHHHHSHKDKALELSNFLGDPCPSSPEQVWFLVFTSELLIVVVLDLGFWICGCFLAVCICLPPPPLF